MKNILLFLILAIFTFNLNAQTSPKELLAKAIDITEEAERYPSGAYIFKSFDVFAIIVENRVIYWQFEDTKELNWGIYLGEIIDDYEIQIDPTWLNPFFDFRNEKIISINKKKRTIKSGKNSGVVELELDGKGSLYIKLNWKQIDSEVIKILL